MKLVIVRHGDPDYSIDSLTPTGKIEAELLARQLVKTPADYYYVSPLGRARDTAAPTMKALGREAQVMDWLQEFPCRIQRPDQEGESAAWDWLPQDWLADERLLDRARWSENPRMEGGHAREIYDNIITNFDALLAEHGYVRDGLLYRAERPNSETLVFFCHFALECVLLSHLMNCSPMVLWHGLCAAPTSVSTIVTEERRPGMAYFRMLRFGDVSHLFMAGQEPSFAARFCEIYGNGDRID